MRQLGQQVLATGGALRVEAALWVALDERGEVLVPEVAEIAAEQLHLPLDERGLQPVPFRRTLSIAKHSASLEAMSRLDVRDRVIEPDRLEVRAPRRTIQALGNLERHEVRDVWVQPF